MPFAADVLKVLIASPSDTRAFRDAVEQALHEWNASSAQHRAVVLLPRRWETDAVPAFGQDVQSVINSQLVDDADVVFGVFHAMLGRPTPRAASGTAEEIERGRRAGKAVHIYFATMPIPYDHDGAQFSLLQQFKRELSATGLYGSFTSAEDLKRQVKAAIDYDLAQDSTWAPRSVVRTPPRDVGEARPAQTVGQAHATSPLNRARQQLFADVLSDVIPDQVQVGMPKAGTKNWVQFASGPFGFWSLVITQTGQLKVEAYLDTGDKEGTKALFDSMFADRERFESEIGASLSWERLDDRRASRIAAYSDASVAIDDPVARERARAWAGLTLARMYAAMNGELRRRAHGR